MHNGLKITAFAAALTATFGAAWGVGAAVDPVVARERPAAHGDGHEKEHEKEKEGQTGEARAHQGLPGGLQISDAGYTLDLHTPRVTAGKRTELRFSVLDEKGEKVTAYEREHGKELHFIVASRDLTGYRHLHPERAADGTWSVTTELPEAGGYRAFADFKPAGSGDGSGEKGGESGEGVTLGADLAATGTYAPEALPKATTTARVDGYEVALSGSLRPGAARELKLTVTKDGRPVTDLQPYLGAYGHLVALRAGDLAYLHVHPNGEPGDGTTKPGPGVTFTATAPSPGAYRLFLDFRHEGKVRTAAFTVHAGGAGAQPEDAEDTDDVGATEGTDGHQH
ncbi:hypothetical protein [Streptomyces daliensis]|uniref:Secreted protein n=1 Tax=Streptomyces daliensis TaxID=299421 RepID=A0A8T4INE4_9ACTN|nr:hypothetical protein [Streptomyces daliensis]